MIATDFPARAGALADEIAANEPSLVGLQEVATWSTGPFGAHPTTVTYDFLQILLDALAARGQHYAPVIVRTNFHAEQPGLFGPSFPADARTVGLTEQTAIIARTDLPTDQLKLSSPQSHDFAVRSSVPTLAGPFDVGGGWLSVDAKVRGKTFRFVDYVLAGPGIEPLSETLVAADPSPSGLWPTDHAGISATLGLDPLPRR